MGQLIEFPLVSIRRNKLVAPVGSGELANFDRPSFFKAAYMRREARTLLSSASRVLARKSTLRFDPSGITDHSRE